MSGFGSCEGPLSHGDGVSGFASFENGSSPFSLIN